MSGVNDKGGAPDQASDTGDRCGRPVLAVQTVAPSGGGPVHDVERRCGGRRGSHHRANMCHGRYAQDADAELRAVMVDIAIDRPVGRETAQSTTHDEPAPE
jgi:hypothetical protein